MFINQDGVLMHMIINKKKIVGLLEYIIGICIVLDANTVWLDKNSTRKIINFIILSICIILIFIIDFNKEIDKKKLISGSLLIIFLLFTNIIFMYLSVDGNGLKLYIERFILFLPLTTIYFITRQKDMDNNLIIKISNIMIILSILSLFFYIFGSTLNIITPNSKVLLDWGGEKYINTYYNLHYEAQEIYVRGTKFIRNTGIFTEAPMYSFNLSIALMAQLFFEHKVKIKKVILLIVTIFSTTSLTGTITAIVLISLKLLFIKSNRKLLRLLKASILPVIIVFLTSIGLIFINEKINDSKNNKVGSYSVRMDDYKIAYEAWEKNKYIGHGFSRHDITQQYMSLSRLNDTGGSNSLIVILPQGGLYLMLCYLVPILICIFISIYSKDLSRLSECIIVVLLFLSTNIPYTYMMICFLAKGWSMIIQDKENINFRKGLKVT